MKHVLPSNLTANLASGGVCVGKGLREILPDGCISFHNYSVASRQVDVIVLCPPLGVLIMEIKPYGEEHCRCSRQQPD